MKDCKFCLATSVILLSTFIFVVATVSAQDKTEKKEIEGTLTKYQQAWNEGNPDAVADCYHQDAKIMTGRNRKFVSTEEYREVHLPQRINRFPQVKFSSPKITVSGNQAVVKVSTKYKGLSKKIKFQFRMTKENGQWFISEQKY